MNQTSLRVLYAFLCLSFVAALIPAEVFAGKKKGCTSKNRCVRGTVRRVVDGDTVVFRPFHKKKREPDWRIRMLNIDTPETKMPTGDGRVAMQYPQGPIATCQLKEVLNMNRYKDVRHCFKKRGRKKQVRPAFATLEVKGTDKYGRKLGRLFYHKEDVNLIMVRSGWAVPYFYCQGKRCNSNFNRRENVRAYAKACLDAKANGRGIFHPDEPLREMPFEFRVRVQDREFTKWVGDFQTKQLYRPTRHDRIHVCKRIFFITKKSAVKIGYEPVETDSWKNY